MSSVTLPLAISAERVTAGHFHLGYRAWLDGVRGIAILLVFLHHLSEFGFQSNASIGAAGFLGVDVFFVMSGFLITCLLLEEVETAGRINLVRFYARRFFRLVPALVVFLACVSIYAALTQPARVAADTYWTSLYSVFYVTNWVNAFQLAPISELLGHMWSLAIEEQFYLVWPAFLLVMLKLRWTRVTVVLSVILLIVLVCAHRSGLTGVAGQRIYSASDTRADSLLAGCVAAMLISWRMLPTSRAFLRALSALSLGALAVVVAYLLNLSELTTSSLYGIGFSVFAIATAILLIQITVNPSQLLRAPLEWTPLVWTGKISYSIYLWHLPICIAVSTLLIPGWAKALLIVAITLALATASHYFVERPFLQVKKRFAVTAVV